MTIFQHVAGVFRRQERLASLHTPHSWRTERCSKQRQEAWSQCESPFWSECVSWNFARFVISKHLSRSTWKLLWTQGCCFGGGYFPRMDQFIMSVCALLPYVWHLGLCAAWPGPACICWSHDCIWRIASGSQIYSFTSQDLNCCTQSQPPKQPSWPKPARRARIRPTIKPLQNSSFQQKISNYLTLYYIYYVL